MNLNKNFSLDTEISPGDFFAKQNDNFTEIETDHNAHVADTNPHTFETQNWTPVLQYSTQTTAPAFNLRNAKYTKIGNVVSFVCAFTVTDIGSGSVAIQITGIPLAPIETSPVAIKLSSGSTTVAYCHVTNTQNIEPLTATFGNVSVWETKTYSIAGQYFV